MKTLLGLSLVLFALIAIAFCIESNNNACLEYENIRLKAMVDNVVNYADSTADTGEMDDFIQSESGQYFFEMYNSINK